MLVRCWHALLGLSLAVSQMNAQSIGRVCVVDPQGRSLPGVQLTPPASSSQPARNAGVDGCAAIALPGKGAGEWTASLHDFATAHFGAPSPGAVVQITLQPATVQQSVTVSAGRGLLDVTDQATSVTVLGAAQLAAAPGLTLDDSLHQVAGFQLFRRTSSWTANPTTEGVSLRGLGSTAASRTLVESDEVPLNDPFGGWIHWDEIPTLAIASVVVERGGAADLYGSSAIGGVIAINPVEPGRDAMRIAADTRGATQNSAGGDLLVTEGGRFGGVLLAGSGLTTGGYVPVAPPFRGSVDQQANVAEQSGRLELRTPTRASGNTAFLRGNVLNEARGNGTALQTNGTRLWRYLAGGDANLGLTHGTLRVFGAREAYRQSFSSIAPNRSSETLTRLQRVPADEFGFSATATRALPAALTAGLGLDLRDIRATDAETPLSGGVARATTSISAHQRALGGYAEGIWQPRRWSVAASIRVDSFRTFDGRKVTGTAVTPEPAVSELVASPHLGVVRQLPGGFSLTANAFRAFRGPTLNELYRTGQVGQQTTLANPALLAERATGFELGGEFAQLQVRGRTLGHVRASYFWTEVNRPISAVGLSETATTQTLQRQNLGQIRSRGLSLETGTTSWRGLDLTVGWQLAVATVTAFNAASAVQANLRGNWIPQVPREAVVVTGNWSRPQLVNLHAFVSYTGHAYDDAANRYLLHPYARVDLSADRTLWRGLAVYAGAQNLLNRAIEAGRTPVLTLAAPRLVEGGLRWELAR